MRHLINEEEVEVQWDKVFLIDKHDSGCSDWAIEGEGSDGYFYEAQGSYQDDELMDVTEIERS